MQPSENCYDIIKKFEGLVLHAYPDPGTNAEPYTIGYGTTIYKGGTKVKLGDVITQEQAEDNLKFEVDKKALAVDSLTKSVQLNQNQFDSLCSLAYNIGTSAFERSTLLKKVLANPNDSTIGEQYMRWNRAGGKVMPGLTKRRQEEVKLYFT